MDNANSISLHLIQVVKGQTLGMAIDEYSYGLVIVTVTPGKAAAKSGVKIGTKIVSVQGIDTVSMSRDDALDLIRKAEGSLFLGTLPASQWIPGSPQLSRGKSPASLVPALKVAPLPVHDSSLSSIAAAPGAEAWKLAAQSTPTAVTPVGGPADADAEAAEAVQIAEKQAMDDAKVAEEAAAAEKAAADTKAAASAAMAAAEAAAAAESAAAAAEAKVAEEAAAAEKAAAGAKAAEAAAAAAMAAAEAAAAADTAAAAAEAKAAEEAAAAEKAAAGAKAAETAAAAAIAAAEAAAAAAEAKAAEETAAAEKAAAGAKAAEAAAEAEEAKVAEEADAIRAAAEKTTAETVAAARLEEVAVAEAEAAAATAAAAASPAPEPGSAVSRIPSPDGSTRVGSIEPTQAGKAPPGEAGSTAVRPKSPRLAAKNVAGKRSLPSTPATKLGVKTDKARKKGSSSPQPFAIGVGDYVIAGSNAGAGWLRYHGEVDFAPGMWCGVELEKAKGKNDGSIEGRQYFSCKENFGIFLKPSSVKKLRHAVGLAGTR